MTNPRGRPVVPQGATGALGRLIDETRALFHHLKRAAEHTHRRDALSGGERAILCDLAAGGPRTVPDLARARPVSRQHIQMLVNPLLERGLVELVDNPRHQRSSLVALTARGRGLTARVNRRERRALAELARELDDADLGQAVDTMRQVREVVDRYVERPAPATRKRS